MSNDKLYLCAKCWKPRRRGRSWCDTCHAEESARIHADHETGGQSCVNDGPHGSRCRTPTIFCGLTNGGRRVIRKGDSLS